MYLLPALSQSYRFDIEAVREITKGTEKTAYPSDQSGTSSRVQWMRAHAGWQGVSHCRKTALRAAKPEVNCAGKRSGEQSVGTAPVWALCPAILSGSFPHRGEIWEPESSNCVGAAQSSHLPRGNLSLGVVYFIAEIQCMLVSITGFLVPAIAVSSVLPLIQTFLPVLISCEQCTAAENFACFALLSLLSNKMADILKK